MSDLATASQETLDMLRLSGFDGEWIAGVGASETAATLGQLLIDGSILDEESTAGAFPGIQPVEDYLWEEAAAEAANASMPPAPEGIHPPNVDKGAAGSQFLTAIQEILSGLSDEERAVCEERAFAILPPALAISGRVYHAHDVIRKIYGTDPIHNWQPAGEYDGEHGRRIEAVFRDALAICRRNDAKQLDTWYRKYTPPTSPLFFLAGVAAYRTGPAIPTNVNMAGLRATALRYLEDCIDLSDERKEAIAMRYGLNEDGQVYDYPEITDRLEVEQEEIEEWESDFFPGRNVSELKIILDPKGRNARLARAILGGVNRGRPSWRSEMACAELDPDELFVKGAAQNEVKRICFSCKVVTECLADAIVHREQFGVAGRMTDRERRVVRRTFMADNPYMWARETLKAEEAVE
jgi:WhiB family transcriptional regulator, redox-sensing transcriptional regulator